MSGREIEWPEVPDRVGVGGIDVIQSGRVSGARLSRVGVYGRGARLPEPGSLSSRR